jgi:hypothetical protein
VNKTSKKKSAAPSIPTLSALLMGATHNADREKPRKPRSTSARANSRDWEVLYNAVRADGMAVLDGPVIVDWDERYVHAIERALVGRKPDELLELLDEQHFLHPVLLPALADVIRSQRDGARGAGKRLTQRQDATIRSIVDRQGDDVSTIRWLASVLDVSRELVRESLRRSATPKGK